jgi:hypothetical protein
MQKEEALKVRVTKASEVSEREKGNVLPRQSIFLVMYQ